MTRWTPVKPFVSVVPTTSRFVSVGGRAGLGTGVNDWPTFRHEQKNFHQALGSECNWRKDETCSACGGSGKLTFAKAEQVSFWGQTPSPTKQNPRQSWDSLTHGAVTQGRLSKSYSTLKPKSQCLSGCICTLLNSTRNNEPHLPPQTCT